MQASLTVYACTYVRSCSRPIDGQSGLRRGQEKLCICSRSPPADLLTSWRGAITRGQSDVGPARQADTRTAARHRQAARHPHRHRSGVRNSRPDFALKWRSSKNVGYNCSAANSQRSFIHMPIRIATFNCENLFSRSRILNLTDTPEQAAKAAPALKAAEQLKKILIKTTYTAADKIKIPDLIKQGKGFFTLEEDRGTLLRG